MLVELMLSLVKVLIDIIFAFLGILPDMPDTLIVAINDFMDLLFAGANIVALFMPMDIVRILIPIVIAIVNFDKILKIIIFILKKIPFLGIE